MMKCVKLLRPCGASLKILRNASGIDQKLNRDIKMLGNILGVSIKSDEPNVFIAVEELRKLSREWREQEGEPTAFEMMVSRV